MAVLKLHRKPTYAELLAALGTAVEMLEHVSHGGSYPALEYLDRLHGLAAVQEAATNVHLEQPHG